MTRHTDWKDVPVLLTVAETARIADVHYNTIHNLVKSGRLKATKIGREWRIAKKDLMDYLGLGEAYRSDRLRQACGPLLSYLELITRRHPLELLTRRSPEDDSTLILSPAANDFLGESLGFLRELTQQLREALADTTDYE
jgi:excisionase family DNA binding protein